MKYTEGLSGQSVKLLKMSDLEKKRIGKLGEEFACLVLSNKGFDILERNLRIGRGEIDILAKEGNEYVFIEVKTRKSFSDIPLLDSVSEEQKEKIYDTAELYMDENAPEDEFRIDLIGITYKYHKVTSFMHIRYII